MKISDAKKWPSSPKKSNDAHEKNSLKCGELYEKGQLRIGRCGLMLFRCDYAGTNYFVFILVEGENIFPYCEIRHSVQKITASTKDSAKFKDQRYAVGMLFGKREPNQTNNYISA